MERYVPLPPLPARISRLNELASDLWWSWNAPAREVFRDLDYPLWRFTDHNPVLLLHLVEQVADRITVLNFGRRIAEGTPAEVLRNPLVVAAYLGEVRHGAA